MANSHAQAIEKQCSIIAAQAHHIATLARQQANLAAKMEEHMGLGHGIGGRVSRPLHEIETTAKEIENRLTGLDMHFRALKLGR